MSDSCRVAIFARTPEPGRVKTRLIPALGARGACQLHQRMLTRIAEQARTAFPDATVELWATPDPGHPFLLELARRLDLKLRRQAPRHGRTDHLGERMAAALASGPYPAMVIGSDAPQLDADQLARLARDLKRPDCDTTLVPALDGGYVALATSGPVALFEGIAWGTDAVLKQTLERGRQQGIRIRLAPAQPDIDRPEDLHHCPADLLRTSD
ncbi:TIGR04282 family arsenosugar biosynthesis glycosyltransferase [Thioalkalivibrio sp. ALE19]|uniref:TIGR04282 family arsenosugar biosynthesis glycosyltransferase n=1 Tax=Thioalkalivibrio sp. ALE19 TaxID=1266909 RepID=UPI00040BB548|nr:TIGR04282 family arsenosugar biosynthesis glycosyltransferase [Thioalkalivibrio sp. ALE19]